MKNKINVILFLILILEFLLQFLLTGNKYSPVYASGLLIGVFLIANYCYKHQKKLPWLYLSVLIILVNTYTLENILNHNLISLLITFHLILLAINWSVSDQIDLTKTNKNSIDVGINRYSICFVSILISVYLAMSGKSELVIPLVFDGLGFILLSLNLVFLMISNAFGRFKILQSSIKVIFSSTVIALLILLISGPYIISTFAYKLIYIQNKSNLDSSPDAAVKKIKKNLKKQEIGYSNDLQLSKKSDLTKKHNPEVYLKLDSADDKAFLKPGKIYLRGASFDTYLNNTWSHYYDRSQWLEDGVDNAADGVIRIQETPKNLHAIKHTVYLLNGWHGNIIALPNISEIYMDKILMEENETYFLPKMTGNQVAFKMTSAYIAYEDMEKKNLVVGKKIAKYLSLLGEVSEKIKNTTNSLFKPNMSDQEKIESILYYFRQNFRYSLVTLNPQERDPLENFFYFEKSGHCELYATSLVVMLRSAGIPSRVCVGYCGGEEIPNSDAYVFYTDQAHAWVEVFFEGYGWVVLDSTPGTSGLVNEENKADPNIAFNPAEFAEIGPNDEKINDSKIAKGIFGWLEVLLLSGSKNPLLMINFMLLTYPISFFFIFGITKVLNYGKKNQDIEILLNPNFIKVIYKKFGKKPKGLTFLEYINKLKEDQKINTELDEIINYYYAVSYGKTKRNAATEKNIIIEVDKIKKVQKI